ncbi:MAG: Formiminotransferase-cyclodeaminase [Acidobacteriota bacterium]|jgi:formiminotetrahydrofolate cyclodeaminase|nr:Formiminotransferase-cyclodeaminase [Acidobacteriota bacterium]
MAAEPQLLEALAGPNGGTRLADTLEAFAAATGVPGSGSANAVTGAFAAALVTAVAAKTVTRADESRYRPISDAATRVAARGRVFIDELLILAEEDAKAFAPVIAWRKKAKTLQDHYKQDQAVRKEIAATKPATVIPLKIAAICLEIAQDATLMLQQGFIPARGESFSALLTALASAEGAIYVARLNITTVSKKITTLDDPGYERPWLKLILQRTDELDVRIAACRDRLGEIRAKERAEAPKVVLKRRRRS